MDKVRMGVVGAGFMGSSHLQWMSEIPEIELAGICDIDEVQLGKMAEKYNCPVFTDYKDLIKKGALDAVLVATPHYFHPDIAIWAFEQGVHVLCEKPVAVHVAEAQRMIDAHQKHPDLKFGLMFQKRMTPMWRQVKKLLDSGELGRIFRISWIITLWYRNEAYYKSGGWRGTWKGEGGGILMNQCPHNLDLYQWFFGMPNRVSAVCHFGKYHQVEIEDDVSAIFEYPDGVTATFVTSTGEFPGSDRLEISCNRGKVVVEGGKISFDRTVEPVDEFTKNSAGMWSVPEYWQAQIPFQVQDPAHKGVIENFVQTILGKEELVAPGEEGIKSLMLANAMLYAGYTRQPVELPLDSKAYEALLKKLTSQ